MSDMLSGGSSTKTEKIPSWIEDAGKNIYGKAKSFYDQGFTPYTGNRVAPLNNLQNKAIASASGGGYGGAVNNSGISATKGALATIPGIKQKTNAGVESFIPTISNVGRIVDENGANGLGKISDYMSPYTEGVIDPAIANINRSADAERSSIGDNAFAAHAFGDARQGVRENELARQTETAIGDTSGALYNQAYQTAMGERASDLDRRIAGATTAAGLKLNEGQFDLGANALQMQGGAQLTSQALAKDQILRDKIATQLGAGNVRQQNAQSNLDVGYQGYQAQQQDQYDRLAALMSVIKGVPYSRSETSSSQVNPLTALSKIFGSFI